jgi:phosphatidylserine/phosphatidylglycerophosphate/cardiolipin synthase-like enzyme
VRKTQGVLLFARFLRRWISSNIPILFVIVLIGLYLLFYFQIRHESSPRPSETFSNVGWYTIYFTDPASPSASSLRGGPDAALAKAIDSACYSVDVAIYRLDLWSIRDALIRAHRRGVRVRVVTDSDHEDEAEIVDLRTAGILVIGDRREPLMHHKFIVIDGIDVWTGSMNYTVSGAYRNNNNLIRIRSSRVGQDYTREFEEMFLEDRFGALSEADTPYPTLTIDGVQVEVYFSPDDGVEDRIVDVLRRAETSIDFMVYTFTSDALAETMLARAKVGVQVRGVIERDQASNLGSDHELFRQAGLDVRMDGNPGNMHHKVIIIDRSIVITGSNNFSRSAEEHNDENVLILYDVEVGQEYLLEFERIFEMAIP